MDVVEQLRCRTNGKKWWQIGEGNDKGEDHTMAMLLCSPCHHCCYGMDVDKRTPMILLECLCQYQCFGIDDNGCACEWYAKEFITYPIFLDPDRGSGFKNY